jgi:hypothetical protein
MEVDQDDDQQPIKNRNGASEEELDSDSEFLFGPKIHCAYNN